MKKQNLIAIITSLYTFSILLVVSCGPGSSGGTSYTHPKPKIVIDESICPAAATGTDPYYASQWHLNAVHVNTPALWAVSDTNKGTGVTIAIIDDGLEVRHDDLCSNVDFDINYNYYDGTNDPTTSNSHGTSVSGVSSALYDNSIGVSGVAPNSEIACFNAIAFDQVYLLDIYDALTRSQDVVDIYNNSWGPLDLTCNYNTMHSLIKDAFLEGLATGRNGKGSIYVWANGNGGESPVYELSSYDEFASFYGVIPIGAIESDDTKSYFSEKGSNLWVVTYSGLYTTDLYNSYTNNFSGTSAAAPLASGIIALMLEAQPELTWRDVKLILADTAEMIPDADWTTNAAGVNINYKYGFGKIDAVTAVTEAKTWSLVGPMLTYSYSQTENEAIPDNNATGINPSPVIDITGKTAITKIEYVTVEVTIDHSSGGDLEIILTSPGGTKSILSEQRTVYKWDENVTYLTETISTFFSGGNTFTFGTARCLNENPDGKWTLQVKDRSSGYTGTLKSWKLTIYGRE